MDKQTLLGFTLIELIFVIILISILASVAYVRWPGWVVNLDAQAQQVASDIRYTQSLAMTKGERYRFVRLSSSTYQITNSSGTAITLPQGNTVATLNTGVSFGTWANLPNNLIAFGGDGTPYTDSGSPGTALSVTATIPLIAGSQTETISISVTTGSVSVS